LKYILFEFGDKLVQKVASYESALDSGFKSTNTINFINSNAKRIEPCGSVSLPRRMAIERPSLRDIYLCTNDFSIPFN
jgi:hypothetical protein